MGDRIIRSLRRQAAKEPYALKLGLRVIDLGPGRALIEMTPGEDMRNIFGMTHGGAIFSLIDEAFELSCNAHGTVALALSMTITYHNPPDPRKTLKAESREVHRSRKTGTYEIRVTDENDLLIATCQALAYRKKDALPFLEEE
jgi:acyl-CoA thioesterase